MDENKKTPDAFEQKIIDAVSEKLNDGTVELLIQKQLEKCISDALGSVFGYGGTVKKQIQAKLDEVMTPVIEKHDFNRYLVKLDDCLSEIINQTSLADNKELLENFKELMRDPDCKQIALSEIFKAYCKHVAKTVDTSGLDVIVEEGEAHYEGVTANIEVEQESSYGRSSFEYCMVFLSCDEDESLNYQIKMMRYKKDSCWKMFSDIGTLNLMELWRIPDFCIFLTRLRLARVDIELDQKSAYECIIPDEVPEARFR